MTRLLSRAMLVALPLFGLACGEATNPDPIDPAVTSQELGARPSYDTSSRAIRGEFRSDDGCPGGFDVCYNVIVKDEGGKLVVLLGSEDWGFAAANVWANDGVVLFSSGDMSGDCDDPGCGNLLKVTGVIYPVRRNNAWVPQVKTTVRAEFNFPEEEDAPEGEVTTTIRYAKQ